MLGGDVNVTDEDGDTPLYVVENVETARFLVERGAVINRQNSEGLSVRAITLNDDVIVGSHRPQPAQYLEDEEFPAVAAYLRSVGGDAAGNGATTSTEAHEQPSQHAQNVASENLTSSLLLSVQDVIRRAQAEGREVPEEELRQIVGRAVIEGVITGYGMGADAAGHDGPEERDGDDAKRPRMEGG